MSPEQYTALLIAVAGLFGALARMIYEIRRTHDLVNSRMTELLQLTRTASLAEGKLHGDPTTDLPAR